MRDRHHPQWCGACGAPMARQEDDCWRCASPRADDPVAAGRRAHNVPASGRPMPATVLEPGLSSAPGPVLSLVRSPEPTPLYTRHMRGAIEVERDRRRVRAGAAGEHPVSARQGAMAERHPMIAVAVMSDARAAAQARLDMDRWADEGGRVPVEAAALLGATTGRS
jgi:hypothetical protein